MYLFAFSGYYENNSHKIPFRIILRHRWTCGASCAQIRDFEVILFSLNSSPPFAVVFKPGYK